MGARRRMGAGRAAGWVILGGVVCGGASGCIGNGRVEQAGAEVIDLVARQTTVALDEYERDMQAVDAGRREAVVVSLAERVKRDGAEQVDGHAAALLQALEKIAADRQVARERYEAARDNIDVLREVAGGLRRFGQRVQQMDEGVRRLGTAVSGKAGE